MLRSALRRPAWRAAAVCSLGLLALGLGHAQTSDDAPAPEAPLQLPAAPQSAALLPFATSADADFRFAVDPASLSVGADGVVRYTLVASSRRGGARNVSYEGIRCETLETRVYAYGRPDGSWNVVQRDWRQIRDAGGTEPQAALAQGVLCVDRIARRSVGAMLQQLRHPQASNL